jgi:hypothetical protein
MSLVTTSIILPTECIGNSLYKINTNFGLLQTGGNDTYTKLLQLSSEMYSQFNTRLNTIRAETVPVSAYNTLVRTLTSFAASGTLYTSLSTSFRSLSARII